MDRDTAAVWVATARKLAVSRSGHPGDTTLCGSDINSTTRFVNTSDLKISALAGRRTN
jgi:hypothetical protein